VRLISSLCCGAVVLVVSQVALCQSVTYDVSINTASLAGTVGSLDFNFNPGPLTTQAASLQILDLATNGTLSGAPALTGAVSGALPAALTFGNGTAFNDYFQGFKFGTSLTFAVDLSGPALSSPGGATSGSIFAFSMFSDAAGTQPTLTNDTTDGFAFTTAVNTDGTTTVTDYSPVTTVVASQGAMAAPEIDPRSSVTAVTFLLGCLCVLRGRRRRR
jgi:hypothetical protein